MSFDWQTEEAVEWDEKKPLAPPPGPEPKHRRRWPWVLLILILLFGLAGLAAYRQLTSRVGEVTDTVETELLASYEVVAGAAIEEDSELLATFLSGRDKEWSRAQELLVGNGSFHDRSGFGLTWQAVPPADAVISTTVNSELNSAEVITEFDYSYGIGNGVTDTVRLQQTAVYRLGPDRWLLAPPDAQFWGETLTKSGYFLTISYPARDETIVERLALDMDTQLADLCFNPDVICPEPFRVNLEFSASPELLMLPSQPLQIGEGNELQTSLPTPTVAGTAVTEAGYRVLSRGYQTQLMRPILDYLSGYACCAHLPFYDAWVAWQLHRLGLQSAPLSRADLLLLSEAGRNLSSGQPAWQSTEPAAASSSVVSGIIYFLIEELRVSPQRIAESLASDDGGTYGEWLLYLTDNRFTAAELEARWQAYLVDPGSQFGSLTPADASPD